MRRSVVMIVRGRILLMCPDRCTGFGLTHELAEVSHNEKYRGKNQHPAVHGARAEHSFHRRELTGRFLSCQEFAPLLLGTSPIELLTRKTLAIRTSKGRLFGIQAAPTLASRWSRQSFRHLHAQNPNTLVLFLLSTH